MSKKYKIYIIFSYTGTFFSKFLRIMTRQKYVHVSISFDKNLTKVYSFGRKNPKYMLPAGFINEDMNLIADIYKNAKCQIYELEIDEKNNKKLKKIIKKFENEKKLYKYNVKGLPYIYFNIVHHREYHYLCSQFIGKIINDSGVWTFDKDYSLLKPNDIKKIEGFFFLFEGKITDYLNQKNLT